MNSEKGHRLPLSCNSKDLNGVRPVRPVRLYLLSSHVGLLVETHIIVLSSHVRTLLRKYCTVLFYCNVLGEGGCGCEMYDSRRVKNEPSEPYQRVS